MVSFVSRRRHFVPNPVQKNYCRRAGAKRRRPLSIHTGYDAEGNRTAQYEITSGTNKSLGTPLYANQNATDITIYTWNNANQMTSATFYTSAADWTAQTTLAAGEWKVTYGREKGDKSHFDA